MPLKEQHLKDALFDTSLRIADALELLPKLISLLNTFRANDVFEYVQDIEDIIEQQNAVINKLQILYNKIKNKFVSGFVLLG